MAKIFASQLRPLLRWNPVIRNRDLARFNLLRIVLEVPLANRTISQLSRGICTVSRHALLDHRSFAQAVVRIPNWLVCLLSALVIHELTTQPPHEVWSALARMVRQPTEGFTPLHVFRLGEDVINKRIMVQQIDGIPVNITSSRESIADYEDESAT